MKANRRQVTLTVGETNTSTGVVINSPLNDNPALQLKIDFEITKYIGSPDIALIRLYNLAPETQRLMRSRYTKVILEYGIDTGNGYVTRSVLFVGQIYNAITNKSGQADIVTTLYCGSGLRAQAEATINRTFAANVGAGELLRALAAELGNFGVEIGVIDDAVDDIPNEGTRGRVMSGAVITMMENVLEGTGIDFTLTDDKINIQKYVLKDTADIVITPANGLVGSARATNAGYDFSCLLNSAIRPGITVGVFSEYADTNIDGLHYLDIPTDTGGRVKVMSTKHVGTNINGTSITEVTGIR